jgi:hypothetical protein
MSRGLFIQKVEVQRLLFSGLLNKFAANFDGSNLHFLILRTTVLFLRQELVEAFQRWMRYRLFFLLCSINELRRKWPSVSSQDPPFYF